MHRLGYTRYVAQGGDQGAAVTDDLAHQAPEGLTAVHMNLLRTALGSTEGPAGTSGVSFAAIVLGTLERHFGQLKVGKWAGDYARTIRKLIEQGQVRRQKEHLAAAFDRWERITVAPTSQQQSPTA